MDDLFETQIASMAFHRHDTPRFDITMSESGVVIPPAGYAMRMRVWEDEGADTTPYMDLRTGAVGDDGETITLQPTSFELFFGTALAQTDFPEPEAPAAERTFYYNIMLTEPGGDVNTYMEGPFVLKNRGTS